MLITAFILGLISSLHCIGMCGPIALMLPLDRNNQAKKTLQIITYNLGRITTYSAIGFVFGLLGKGFFMAGLQQKLSIIVGILMILIILLPSNQLSKFNFTKPIFNLISTLKSTLGNQFRRKSFKSLFIIGLLNGFLPCGMVYLALFGAMAMQNPLFGSFYMLLFGLGTIPMMSFVSVLSNYFTIPIRNKIQKTIPFITVLIGTLFILRGMGLGIPYVSPDNLSLFIQANPNCK